MDCAECTHKECYGGRDCTGMKDEILAVYNTDRTALDISLVSSRLEAEHYMKMSRLEELMAFSKQMGFVHLGIAFCVGLSDEAEYLHHILSKDFAVSSICCKVCGIEKECLDLPKIDGNRVEAMCDPIGQAVILDQAGTALNIIFGLCIGHDILFTQHSKAPVTTLVIKDRVLAHNPIGAIYSGYYRRNRISSEE